MGKRIKESEGEVELSASIYEYYATHAEQFLVDMPLTPGTGSAYVRKEPIGVLLGIEPWNYPYYQVARFAAPNIMAGNCIMLKHASNVRSNKVSNNSAMVVERSRNHHGTVI